MSKTEPHRGWTKHGLPAALALLILSATGAGARDDGGQRQFMLDEAQRSAPAARADTASELPVRSAHRPVAVRPRAVAATPAAPGAPRPGPVSIFEDKTLRAGDVVMLSDGLHVFSGSSSWPYRLQDFTPLAQATGIGADLRKELAAMDAQPRLPPPTLASIAAPAETALGPR